MPAGPRRHVRGAHALGELAGTAAILVVFTESGAIDLPALCGGRLGAAVLRRGLDHGTCGGGAITMLACPARTSLQVVAAIRQRRAEEAAAREEAAACGHPMQRTDPRFIGSMEAAGAIAS
jgi:hypothetical protein